MIVIVPKMAHISLNQKLGNANPKYLGQQKGDELEELRTEGVQIRD